MWTPTQPDQIQQDNALIAQMILIDEAVRHYTAELKTIDEDLELVKASNDATLQGLIPGYWHIIRKGTPCNILALQGPNGEFREPGSWMYQWLLEQDLWNERTQKINQERVEKAEKARQRERELERQDKIDEFNERVESLKRGHVSMTSRSGGWSASSAGRRQGKVILPGGGS